MDFIERGGQTPDPAQERRDYVRALEVMAEVSGPVVEELVAEAGEQAEGITRYAGIRMLREVMRQADALTHWSAPQRVVDQARYFTWKAVQEEAGAEESVAGGV